MKINITYRKRLVFYFFCFLAMANSLFHLAVFKDLPISDLALIFGAILFLCGFQFNGKIKYNFLGAAVFAVVLSVTSAIQSYLLNGQPMWLGIRPQRLYLMCWLLYFPISSLLQRGKLKKEDLIKALRWCGRIQLALYIVQFFAGTDNLFLNINVNERYGAIRLYGSAFFIDMLYILSLNEQIRNKKLSKTNLAEIAACLLYIILIRKGRMITLCYVLILCVALLFWRSASGKKIIAAIALAVGLGFLLNEQILSSILNAISGSQIDVNVAIRASAAEYYWAIVKANPLLGGGFVNTEYAPAAGMAGVNQNYYFVDNGIIGYLYQYGFLGAFWNVILCVKLAVMGISALRKEKDYTVVLLLLFTLIGMRTGAWIAYYLESFRIVFLCILMDLYVSAKKTNLQNGGSLNEAAGTDTLNTHQHLPNEAQAG